MWQPNVSRYCRMSLGSKIIPSWEPLLCLNSTTLEGGRQEADEFNMKSSHRSWISKQKDFIWTRNGWGHFDWASLSLDLDVVSPRHPTPQSERPVILIWLWSWGWWLPAVEGVNDFPFGIFVQMYLDFFTNKELLVWNCLPELLDGSEKIISYMGLLKSSYFSLWYDLRWLSSGFQLRILTITEVSELIYFVGIFPLFKEFPLDAFSIWGWL